MGGRSVSSWLCCAPWLLLAAAAPGISPLPMWGPSRGALFYPGYPVPQQPHSPCPEPSDHLAVSFLLQTPQASLRLPSSPMHLPTRPGLSVPWKMVSHGPSNTDTTNPGPIVTSQEADSQHPTSLCPPTWAHLSLAIEYQVWAKQPSKRLCHLVGCDLQLSLNPSLKEGLPTPRSSFPWVPSHLSSY